MGFTSLRIKILFSFVALAVLFGLSMIVFTQTHISNRLHRMMEQKGVEIAKRIATECDSSVITEQYFRITMMFNDLMVSERDIVYAYVLDGFGREIAGSFEKGVPQALVLAHQADMQQPYSIKTLYTDKGAVLDTAIPLMRGQVGVLHLGLSQESVDRDVNTITTAIVLFSTGILIIGILISFWYARNITQPLIHLAVAAEAYGKGEESQYLQIDSKDEIGELASIFNKMMERRRFADAEREKLIGELREAMKKIKTLSGFIPICASCKRIRDDQGYWNQLEAYIKDRSDAEFSHSICPECANKLYPELMIAKKSRKGDKRPSR